MKSKIEVRTFAVNKAVEIMGHGTPQKDVIEKAKEIERYILGDAELPEVHNDMLALNGIMGNVMSSLKSMMDAPSETDETKEA